MGTDLYNVVFLYCFWSGSLSILLLVWIPATLYTESLLFCLQSAITDQLTLSNSEHILTNYYAARTHETQSSQGHSDNDRHLSALLLFCSFYGPVNLLRSNRDGK